MFKLKQRCAGINFVLLGIGLALILWGLESAIDALVFKKGDFLKHLLTLDIEKIWMRLIAISLIIIFSVIVQIFINKQRQAEKELKKHQNSLEKLINERTKKLTKVNKNLKGEIAERRRTEDMLKEKATRLELITHVSQRTTTILDLDELIHQAVNLIRDTFNYLNVFILLVDDNDIVLKASTHPSLQVLEGELRIKIGSEGITGWVASKGEPLIVPDVSLDPRYYNVIPEELKTKSEIAVPIKWKGRVIGVLDAQSIEYNAFSQTDLFTLQTVANQLAISIENAHLYETAHQEIMDRKRAEEALKESEDRFHKLSITDALTNIYNRRYFYDEGFKVVEYVKRHKGCLTIAILDIDYFKRINDTYGHQAGDYILKEFSSILKSRIRPYDVLARYGGEEFAIIFRDIDKKTSKRIILRIKEYIENYNFTFENEKIELRFSGGISDINEVKSDNLIIEELIKIADDRLYFAKNSGRNKIIDNVSEFSR
jgi:diguanylate cyclase (GGDEF)-like protein